MCGVSLLPVLHLERDLPQVKRRKVLLRNCGTGRAVMFAQCELDNKKEDSMKEEKDKDKKDKQDEEKNKVQDEMDNKDKEKNDKMEKVLVASIFHEE